MVNKMEKNISNKIISFMKGEMVLCIALLLALGSSFMVKPNKEYVSYIDFRVLVLLFCLMLVVAGLKSLGVFRLLGEKLCVRVKNVRQLAAMFVVLCFVTSMLITNDVALITFVPFSISVLIMAGDIENIIWVVVLETVAANLGSMLTPIGNPQNLLIFSLSGMSASSFVNTMLPLTIVSFFLVFVCLFRIKRAAIAVDSDVKSLAVESMNKKKLVIEIILFLVCLGNVFHLYSHWVVLVIVSLTIFIVDKKLFSEVDYSLLFTFVGFFIFIGNMKQIESIHTFLASTIMGNEFVMGVLLSQVISNVPAAMLLSGFTTDYQNLLYGVNVGGLGTLIASMASLISYRFYAKEFPTTKKKYFYTFTVLNVVMLLILILFVVVVKPICF